MVTAASIFSPTRRATAMVIRLEKSRTVTWTVKQTSKCFLAGRGHWRESADSGVHSRNRVTARER